MSIYVTDYDRARMVVEGQRKLHIDGFISVGSDPKDQLAHQFNPSLQIICNDVARDWQGRTAPTEEQVQQAIDFGRGFTDDKVLLIHCAMGVSRSSGFALAILVDRLRDPDKAIVALDQAVRDSYDLKLRFQARDHCPNCRIIMHLDSIYGLDRKLIDAYCARFGVRDFDLRVNTDYDEWALPL